MISSEFLKFLIVGLVLVSLMVTVSVSVPQADDILPGLARAFAAIQCRLASLDIEHRNVADRI